MHQRPANSVEETNNSPPGSPREDFYSCKAHHSVNTTQVTTLK